MQRIFVGDVQGCSAELDEILDRAGERFGEDFELWLVGDLINRGPGNRRALERVRPLVEAGRARYVLGNHELAFLSAHLGLRAIKPTDSIGELLADPDAEAWFEWLRRRPLVECGSLGETRFAMVHAAVHPNWSLSKLQRRARKAEARLADPDLASLRRWLGAADGEDTARDTLGRITSCRSVARDGGWSREEPQGALVPWHETWRAREHDYAIVYGHWAMQGLHCESKLRGLDTGCVHHGRGHDGFLTAWLPDPKSDSAFAIPDDRFWQVPAHRHYYRDSCSSD